MRSVSYPAGVRLLKETALARSLSKFGNATPPAG